MTSICQAIPSSLQQNVLFALKTLQHSTLLSRMNKEHLYAIQRDFIDKAQNIVTNENIGIFSSPTGTGKTLSLLYTLEPFLTKKNVENVCDENKELLDLLYNESPTCRIFYCSRTHSQLAQVVDEVKRIYDISAVIIGSKKLYCANSTVNTYKDYEIINEKCNELIDKDHCIYYTNYKIKEHDIDILKGTQNIEDIKKIAKDCKICPYYLSKQYVKKCEIVFLPYNLLFAKEGRESLNLKIKDSIIIIDEAHNIYEAVIQMNTVSITYEMIAKYALAINNFKLKYEKRMLPVNLYKVKSIYIVLQRLKYFLEQVVMSQSSSPDHDENVCGTTEFLLKADLCDFNFLDLEDYVKETRLTQKLEGFSTNLHLQFYNIFKFFRLIIESDDYGKIFYTTKKIRFTPMDGQMYFQDFLDAKSIILAGGTMEPIDNIEKVFSGRKIEYHAYDSICKNFRAFVLSEGPSKKEIKLTYENRNSDTLLKDIINTISNLANCVKKGGIICFVPSKTIMTIIKEKIKSQPIRKMVLYENECTFDEYKNALNNQSVVFFGVMGGKMSEGINFNDNLCRLLIIIGIPYPTINAELQERVVHNGKEHCKITAMKIVNQAIGRALRHKNDHACIVLLDSRYTKLLSYLSPWVSKNIANESFLSTLQKTNYFLKNQDAIDCMQSCQNNESKT